MNNNSMQYYVDSAKAKTFIQQSAITKYPVSQESKLAH